ncbi:hypothetical protein GH714_014609 [Hevea brasiliensis]|uniref:Bulb-type lectin domain-containing protein n=1 Tax=Hevea brasiliensis TaxID=3981 RepID=A0A6A6KQU5_HEVBR|nr:hypothetical protein GH714_014609 [Hevea brasiliensis]
MESFKNPTDTMLPSQTLESGTVLFSSLSETNFSTGRFELYFDNGDLRLRPLAWPTEFKYNPYFSSGTSASGSQLVFNGSSHINLIQTNGTIVQLPWKSQNVASSVATHYYRATIDYNGVFTQYAYPRGNNGEQSWSIVQYIPENVCYAIFNDLGSGSCGYNSYCRMSNGRPTCTCPTGYSLMDQNNPFGGCKPNFPLGCGLGDASENLEDLYELQELKYVNWPLGDYERLHPYSEDECRTSCLQDCMCDVAIYNDNSDCWKKRIPLGNGRVEIGNTKALMKVRKGPWDYPGPASSIDKKDKSILLGSLSGSLALNAFLLIIVPLILFFKQKWKSDRVTQQYQPLLAIWFHKIPDKTIVWSANGDNPAQQGSMLQITATDLLLTDPSDQRIWNGEINPTATVSYGAMLDTGNFVLIGTNSDYLWESFKNPIDTILPSQTLESDTVLFSRLSKPTSPEEGLSFISTMVTSSSVRLPGQLISSINLILVGERLPVVLSLFSMNHLIST